MSPSWIDLAVGAILGASGALGIGWWLWHRPLIGIASPKPRDPRRVAPWPDFAGNEIREGDLLRHPTGTVGLVVFRVDRDEPGSTWVVDYQDVHGIGSRLCLQIGDRGMARVWRPTFEVPSGIDALETDRYTIHVTPSSAGIVVEIYDHRLPRAFGRGMADRFDLALAGALKMAAYTERLAQESTDASRERS